MSKCTQDRLKAFFKCAHPRAVEDLSSWIKEPSLAGAEEGVQRKVKKYLDDLGFKTDMYYMDYNEISKNPNFVSPRTDFSTSPNVVGVLESSTKDGKSLILNGHVDVVPVGDPESWTVDPFGGKYDAKTDKLYGRGTSDMKAGLYAKMLAVKALVDCGVKLRGDIIVQSVVEEESGGAGTLSAILKGYKADAAIIGEPTGLKIFPKQQGSMWFRIKVFGKGAHGGTRYEGVSAIEKSMIVVKHLLDLETARNIELKTDPLFQSIPIPVPINVGTISGGKWPSSVADLVTIEGRMGVIPGELIPEARNHLQTHLKKLAGIDAWFESHPPHLEFYGAFWDPGSVPTTHEIVQLLSKNFETILGSKPKIEASPWATDGGRLTNLADTPAVIFGPGVTNMAHFADEYVFVHDVIKCAEVVAQTIMDFCGVIEA